MMPVGDYFDLKGNYLGSDNVDDKEIRIVNTQKHPLSSTYSNLPFNFKNRDGSVNRSIGLQLSKNVGEFGVGDRTAMAGNIYNHYYQEAGYDLGETQSGAIDNVPSNFAALGLTSIGGVTAPYPGLGDGQRAISMEYSALGRVLNNGNDILNLISHERGQHMPDTLNQGMSMGKWNMENRATLHQLQDPTWKGTSPAFRDHIRYNQGGYLYPSEFKRYFGTK